jgi:hypothetical protein
VNNASQIEVSGNTFTRAAGATGTTGVNASGTNATRVIIGPNNYDDVATPINAGWSDTRDIALVMPRRHEAITTSRTLALTDNNEVINNTGATGLVELTLPPTVSTGRFEFVVTAAQTLRIRAPAGVTIRLNPTTVSSSGGYLEANAIGASITVNAMGASAWIASAPNGTWTAA